MSSAGNPLVSGIDPSHIDNSFRPQDDLYRYFNGTWLKNHQIPQDRSSDGVTYQLFIEAEARFAKLLRLQQVKGTPRRSAIYMTAS